jgi:cytochrome b subunit of formate dehydrogenase
MLSYDRRLVGQSVLEWPDLYYYLTATGLLMWDALFDERTGLSFARVTVSSTNISLFSVCTIYILHAIKRMYKCMYVQYDEECI